LTELDGGGEVVADPVLGHRPGGPAGGVAAGEAAAHAAVAELRPRALVGGVGTAEAVAQAPGGRHPEHLVDAAGGDGGGLGQPVGREQPDAVDLAEQGGVHAGGGPGRGLSAGGPGGLPKAARGNSSIGADRSIGRSGGREAIIWAAASAAPGSSSSL